MTDTLKSELSSLTDQAALICPRSGLTIANNLPPLPTGLYLPLEHPLVSLIPTLLNASTDSKHWAYLTSLPKDIRSGALLAALNYLGKVAYEDGFNPYAARLSMSNTWTVDQIDSALSFLSTRIAQCRLAFGTLVLTPEKRLTPEVWDSWTASILKLDHYTANAEANGWIVQTLEEWTNDQLDANIAKSRIAKPTPQKLAKQLNAEAYDAYLEFKQYLPTRTQEKAASIVKQLATTHLSDIVESFLDGVSSYALGSNDAQSAYQELIDAVRTTRTQATEAGLILCFDSPSTELDLEVESKPVVVESLKEKLARLRKGSV